MIFVAKSYDTQVCLREKQNLNTYCNLSITKGQIWKKCELWNAVSFDILSKR